MDLLHGAVIYGGEKIEFQVLEADRKTLEIAVHPDRSVVVKAPIGTPFSEVEKKILRRAGWILRQFAFFRQFEPRTPERRYIGGESHFYLGRQYRLKIRREEQERVRLIGGYFCVEIKENAPAGRIKVLLERWYLEKARERFQESLTRCWPAIAKDFPRVPRLQIRRMKKRWGSLSANGLLTLNTDLIRAPRECIDYVIIHELCHLQSPDHGPEFYHRLEAVMPDWERRKQKLEQILS